MKQNKLKKVLKITSISILLVVVLIVVVAIIIIGKMVNDGVLYQNRENDTKNNSIKQLEDWGYDREAFHKEYQGKDFAIQSADGNTVPGTIFYTDKNQPWVVLVHGAGGDREFVICCAQMYLEKNYNVLTYDQRGHGDNSDERVTFGINEAHDVEALVDYLKNEYGANDIILHGQSMGGATAALYAASEHGNVNLSACILDSPVPGMELFLRDMFMEEECDEDTANAIIWCGKLYSKIFSNLDYEDGDTIEKAKNINVPTFVIVSKQDSVCLPKYVKQVYESINAQKKLSEFDCEHIKGIFDCKEDYYQEITDFLDEVLVLDEA